MLVQTLLKLKKSLNYVSENCRQDHTALTYNSLPPLSTLTAKGCGGLGELAFEILVSSIFYACEFQLRIAEIFIDYGTRGSWGIESMNRAALPNRRGVLWVWNGAMSGMSRYMSVACRIRTASYATVRFIASYCGLVRVSTILSGSCWPGKL